MKKILIALVISISATFAQSQSLRDSVVIGAATLEQCIQYALAHQPAIEQARLDERITDYNIRSRLADWYPQIGFGYSLQHNFQRTTSFFNGVVTPVGVSNTSGGQLSATQNIFTRDLLLARRTQGDVRLQASTTTAARKIDLAVAITKAFYDVLTTRQQINVASENIIRLQKSLSDAFYRYQSGIADKTDYKRAQITLNNTIATRQANQASIIAKIEYLKSLMGYPVVAPLTVLYDSLKIEREVAFDTLQPLDASKRVDYQLLVTQNRLQQANVIYQRNSFLPTVAVNGGYNFNYLNNNFAKLYSANYPNSFVGLTAAIPIFQGGKRKANIKVAEWQLTRSALDLTNFENSANSQYATALAAYKGSLANYLFSKSNVALAQEVYEVIQLQYTSGIKTYLEVITAEADLRTAQINYFNSLYQVLSSKVDAQRALGLIVY